MRGKRKFTLGKDLIYLCSIIGGIIPLSDGRCPRKVDIIRERVSGSE